MTQAGDRRPHRQVSDAYIGRFAPSPTGPLHFGSVLAAIGSWLDARTAGGQWLVRIDDLDTPRNVNGAATRIFDELLRLGLEWDGAITRQSDNPQPYQRALTRLRTSGAAFACGCSRKNLPGGTYPGTCREGLASGVIARSTRLRVCDEIIIVDDLVQGRYAQNLQTTSGDFVVLRADGIVAYHLATVVDDAAAGITHVIRGADLLESTPRQIALQRALGLTTPRYAHLPVATNAGGQKLSKQAHAAATEQHTPARLWCESLRFLGYRDTDTMCAAGLKEIRDWALTRWSLARVPVAPIAVDPELVGSV
jgi:glutamyl-Q tRNA(Asp) synthetase